MAYKSFRTLTPRNQSSLVTQLHKLINYYGEIFCPRERAYIKSLSQNDGAIYWLEDDAKKIIAVAIVDPNYELAVDDIEIHLLGHTISKRPGQMDRILHHIWSDYEDQTIAVLCRKSLTSAFDIEDLKLIELSAHEIVQYWPALGQATTSYFNLSNEKIIEGLARKDYTLFMKFSDQDLAKIKSTKPDLFKVLDLKLAKVAAQSVQ
jgi:hypothetical protein